MSLLKWKELAKSKTKLGNKINYVHNLITQHKIGENTSQESFAKVFKPVTSKLDDVIVSNLISKTPQRRRPRKKGGVPDYGIDIEDEVEEMGLDNLFGDYVPPQQEKQMGPVPPPYEEFYIDPEYYQTKQKTHIPKKRHPKTYPLTYLMKYPMAHLMMIYLMMTHPMAHLMMIHLLMTHLIMMKISQLNLQLILI